MTIEFWDRYGNWPKMHTVYPDGIEHGEARIVHHTVTAKDVLYSNLARINGKRGGREQEGDLFAQLHVGGTLWMSDTADERMDHYQIVREARGDVLIGGLGLGMVALACALKEGVESVTVIEINQDVADLVRPHLEAVTDKIDIVVADIFAWKPPKGAMWDAMWFDVWENICTDNLPKITKLNRKFARRRKQDGWRGAWVEEHLRYLARQEKDYYDNFYSTFRGRS